MHSSTSTDDGFPIRCQICGSTSIVNVSKPPGDSVCPACGSFLWLEALVEVTRLNSFVPDLCISQLDAGDRDDAIRELTRLLAEKLCWTTDQEVTFRNAVVKGEGQCSTGIGSGFAIPHASVDWIDHCHSVMAFIPDGIPFNSVDGDPVHTIILVASPKSRPGEYLSLLERLSFSLRRTGPSAI